MTEIPMPTPEQEQAAAEALLCPPIARMQIQPGGEDVVQAIIDQVARAIAKAVHDAMHKEAADLTRELEVISLQAVHLRDERNEARHNARCLAFSYGCDSRPLPQWVEDSLAYPVDSTEVE